MRLWIPSGRRIKISIKHFNGDLVNSYLSRAVAIIAHFMALLFIEFVWSCHIPRFGFSIITKNIL